MYNDDNKKIIFALSFMNSGPAQAWKESFITQKTDANGNMNLGLVMKKKKKKKKEHTIGPNDRSVHVVWTMDMVEVRGER